MTNEQSPTEYPILLRILLAVGRPFGVHFVPQRHLQVINYMGQYSCVKGPGLITHNRITESLGPLVYVGGQFRQFNLQNLLTRDVLPVGLRVHAIIGYDPRQAPDLAPILTRVPREAYVNIAEVYLRWGMLAAVSRYNATELAQHEVAAQIEDSVRARVAEEMEFLGIQPRGKIRIMQVDLPASLTGRHETIAQRRASILAGTEYHPAEFRRALVTEVIENLGRAGSGEAFVNFNELVEAYAAERAKGGAARPVIDNPPQPTMNKGAAKPPPRPKSRL